MQVSKQVVSNTRGRTGCGRASVGRSPPCGARARRLRRRTRAVQSGQDGWAARGRRPGRGLHEGRPR